MDEGLSLEGDDGYVGVEEGVVGEGFSVLVVGSEGKEVSEETEGGEDTEEEGESTVTAPLQEQSRTAATTRRANKRIFFM